MSLVKNIDNIPEQKLDLWNMILLTTLSNSNRSCINVSTYLLIKSHMIEEYKNDVKGLKSYDIDRNVTNRQPLQLWTAMRRASQHHRFVVLKCNSFDSYYKPLRISVSGGSNYDEFFKYVTEGRGYVSIDESRYMKLSFEEFLNTVDANSDTSVFN